MKIGIVTQSLLNNYGGILQNYALQKVLKELGHEPITIDYVSRYSFKKYIIYTLKTFFIRLMCKKKSRGYVPFYRKRNTMMSDFVVSNVSVTKPVKKYTSRILDEYGIEGLIVGSDQVWRPEYNNDLFDMFFSFAKEKNILKISYAASFGIDFWNYTMGQTLKCKELIKDFKAISVRESSGIDLCKTKLNVDAVEVLDPTLLLPKEFYEKICCNIPRTKVPYLASYILDLDRDKKDLIYKIAEKKKVPVEIYGADLDAKLSIPEWLSMFRDAEFIVTDSFHGTLFSIIFRKNFITIGNKNRGLSRFNSILSKLGLQDRLISDVSDYSGYLNIDWSKVEDLLDIAKSRSYDFLNSNIK